MIEIELKFIQIDFEQKIVFINLIHKIKENEKYIYRTIIFNIFLIWN